MKSTTLHVTSTSDAVVPSPARRAAAGVGLVLFVLCGAVILAALVTAVVAGSLYLLFQGLE